MEKQKCYRTLLGDFEVIMRHCDYSNKDYIIYGTDNKYSMIDDINYNYCPGCGGFIGTEEQQT